MMRVLDCWQLFGDLLGLVSAARSILKTRPSQKLLPGRRKSVMARLKPNEVLRCFCDGDMASRKCRMVTAQVGREPSPRGGLRRLQVVSHRCLYRIKMKSSSYNSVKYFNHSLIELPIIC